jgi:hypothetical protein
VDRIPTEGRAAPLRRETALDLAVLPRLRTNKWPIRAHLEYEQQGTGTPGEDVRRCCECSQQALA